MMTLLEKPAMDKGALSLPRLCYIGDVPVEHSYHGSALLYRLLQNYPACRVRVVEVRFASEAGRRLSDVEYRFLRLPFQRLLFTRFHRFASTALVGWGGLSQSALSAAAEGFSPDSVLTVVHGYSWRAAVKFARKRNLPYHLIIHDDWEKTSNPTRMMMPLLQRQFADAYRNAASRLCVSPYMAKYYSQKYGVSSEVLYPSRAAGVVNFDSPSPRVGAKPATFTVAFAGTINGPGYVAALRSVAQALKPIGGQLTIFGPLTSQHAQKFGLDEKNVVLKGLLSPDELVRICREEADALILPVPFDSQVRSNADLAFPSKLTDYTAMGLPIIIFGPSYSSAVKWAAEYRDVADVIDRDDVSYLAAEIARLARDPQRRIYLACRALEVGKKCFSHSTAERKFFESLLQKSTSIQ